MGLLLCVPSASVAPAWAPGGGGRLRPHAKPREPLGCLGIAARNGDPRASLQNASGAPGGPTSPEATPNYIPGGAHARTPHESNRKARAARFQS